MQYVMLTTWYTLICFISFNGSYINQLTCNTSEL